MFVKTSTRLNKGVVSKTHYLVEGFRENGKVKHKNLCNLSFLSDEQILSFKTILNSNSSKASLADMKELTFLCAKEYGSIAAFSSLYEQFIEKHINKKYQSIVKAMIVNRVFEPKSKNGLGNWLKRVDNMIQSYPKNLPYEALDYLEKHQSTIEKNMFKKNKKCNLFLYDITSTYFEGQAVEMAKYGYSRDHRSDRLQVNIGLVTDDEGCPIAVEILEGNIVDKSTIQNKIDDLKSRFGLEEITFVFDRGMKSKVNLEYIKEAGFQYITALSHQQLKKVAEENKQVQQSLFDKNQLAEFEINNMKYVLSYNPSKAWKDTTDRDKLIDKTIEKLEKISNLKKMITPSKVQDKVSKVINKYNCEKYLTYEIQEIVVGEQKFGKIVYKKNQDKIDYDQKHDGFYMVESTVLQETGEKIEKTYKSLQFVERAFDVVKNMIDLRPIFHYKDTRVKGHIIICFLAYYLVFQFKNMCKKQLEDHTLDTLLTELKDITKGYFTIQNFTISRVSECNELQKNLLTACGVIV